MATLTIIDKKKIPVKGISNGLIKPPVIDFKIVLDMDSTAAKEAFADKLLLKKFTAQAEAILKMTVDMVEKKIALFEQQVFMRMFIDGAPVKVFTTNLDGFNKAITKDFEVATVAAEQGCEKVWQELVAHNKAWSKFKWKTRVSIAGSAGTFAVSIAAMASSPFTGGAGSALAIVGFIKSSLKILEDIKKLTMGIDQALTNFTTELGKVEQIAKNSNLYIAREIEAAVFNEFVGASRASLKSTQSAAAVYQAYCSKLVSDLHKLSKEVTKLETEAGKQSDILLKEGQKKLKGVSPIAIKYCVDRVKENYNKNMAPALALIAEQDARLHKMYKKATEMEGKANDLMGRMKKLELKDPKGLKVFRETLKLASVALSPLDGTQLAVEATELGMGLGNAAAGFAWDKASSKYFEGTIFDAA